MDRLGTRWNASAAPTPWIFDNPFIRFLFALWLCSSICSKCTILHNHPQFRRENTNRPLAPFLLDPSTWSLIVQVGRPPAFPGRNPGPRTQRAKLAPIPRTPSACYAASSNRCLESRSEEHTSELQSLRHLLC